MIDVGAGFVVKRITVRPGQRLSLQRHRHRAEQWVVVAGTAQVTRGDAVFALDARRDGCALHRARRIASRTREPIDVVFIEVQIGTLLSEDDIERLDDVYGRIPPSDKRSGD